ncbi:UDP-glucose 4-epimerase GalE [Vreelandella lutescens]|uniref:UDP-glucose 4-epimerase n=1 Tax=Vreelandella lutescens TaxID=1602943 RepID=A0ABQ1PMV7_9GAMM|nr:UDP-glucose 4-epimerase GalE [Halomonas lutescens]GGC99782.1 UDP-glucose 4-epimerase [Halomonas lutescens]
MNVFVTGGAGYIGSHTCLELLLNGWNVTVFDNFSNSCSQSLDRVEKITNRKISLIEGDVRNTHDLTLAIKSSAADAVIHFAGLKSVGESNAFPVRYYDNNVTGTISLLKAMVANELKKLVFSSSATVYGTPEKLPIPEVAPTSTTNPYGQSKLMVEKILSDVAKSDDNWKIANLRYFNPAGADESGLIGENPKDIPNNIMPYISQVAVGKLRELSVFGGDYDTHDGTGVRDYIHVSDLAKGHLSALKYISNNEAADFCSFNLGTGKGVSVLELVKAFEKASGKSIPFDIVARRQGDVAACYADPTKANKVLGWKAELDIERICQDAWRWQVNNPTGY